MSSTTSTQYFTSSYRDVSKELSKIGLMVFLSACTVVLMAVNIDKCKSKDNPVTDKQTFTFEPFFCGDKSIINYILFMYAIIMLVQFISLLLANIELQNTQNSERAKKMTQPSSDTLKMFKEYAENLTNMNKFGKGIYVILVCVAIYYLITNKQCIKWCCSCSV